MTVFYHAKHAKPRVNWKETLQWTLTFIGLEIFIIATGILWLEGVI